MSFDEIPVIPVANIYRAAMVSTTRGDRVLRELYAQQKVTPIKTPTGRIVLSPTDGRTVYEALTRAA